MNAKADKKKDKPPKISAMDIDNTEEIYIPGDADGDKKGSKKRLSIERIYQKKSQLEHILLRPDTYIGSTETVTQVIMIVTQEKIL